MCTHAEKIIFSCKNNYSKALHIYELLPTKKIPPPPQKKKNKNQMHLKNMPMPELHTAFAAFFSSELKQYFSVTELKLSSSKTWATEP